MTCLQSMMKEEKYKSATQLKLAVVLMLSKKKLLIWSYPAFVISYLRYAFQSLLFWRGIRGEVIRVIRA